MEQRRARIAGHCGDVKAGLNQTVSADRYDNADVYPATVIRATGSVTFVDREAG